MCKCAVEVASVLRGLLFFFLVFTTSLLFWLLCLPCRPNVVAVMRRIREGKGRKG